MRGVLETLSVMISDHTCIQELLITEAQCSNCTSWMMEAAEVRTSRKIYFPKNEGQSPPIRRNPDNIAGQGAGDKHCELPRGRLLETKSRSRLEGPINLFSKTFNPFLR